MQKLVLTRKALVATEKLIFLMPVYGKGGKRPSRQPKGDSKAIRTKMTAFLYKNIINFKNL